MQLWLAKMKLVKVNAFDLPDAWYQVLKKIWEEGEPFPVGYGSETTNTKKLDITIAVLHPENQPLLHDKAPCDMSYVTNYFMEYLWFGEKKPDETYTYSSRLRSPVDQIEGAINRYVEEIFDRQVTLVVRVPEDINKEIGRKRHEPPCLTILDTEITRDESDKKLKLTLVGYWRSWDAYGALPANLAGLQLFSEAFVKELNTRGREKHGAKWGEVYTGPMLMHSKNCHIYQRQFSLVEELMKTKRQTFSASWNRKNAE
jgi:thymidylate synthase